MEVKLTAMVRSHASRLCSKNSSKMAIPALFTNTSRPPKSSRARATIASQTSGWVTSPTKAWASPKERSSFVVFSTRSATTSTSRIRAPSRRNFSAVARPIPRPAPVMMAALPSNRPTLSSPFSRDLLCKAMRRHAARHRMADAHFMALHMEGGSPIMALHVEGGSPIVHTTPPDGGVDKYFD